MVIHNNTVNGTCGALVFLCYRFRSWSHKKSSTPHARYLSVMCAASESQSKSVLVEKYSKLQRSLVVFVTEKYRIFYLLLAVTIPMAGCVSGVRYVPPNDGPVAELIVTSNRAVTNQWVRIHKNGCDYETSELVGALNNITAGWASTGPQLNSVIKADQRITLGVLGLVSEALLNENGSVIGTRYSECYPTAEFYVKPGYKYYVRQSSEIRGDKAYCGYNMYAVAPNGIDNENVDFKLGKCGRPR